MANVTWRGLTLIAQADIDHDEIVAEWHADLGDDPSMVVSVYQYADGSFDGCITVDSECFGNHDKKPEPVPALDESLDAALAYYKSIVERLEGLKERP